MRHPQAIDFLGHAQLALVELAKHMLDGIADAGRGGARREVGAVFPRGFDDGLEFAGHGEGVVRFEECGAGVAPNARL